MSPSATDEKPTLMLLDGNSLAFRAFYALPAENFKTQGGLTTNAVYGFTAMLINLLRDESPTHVAAAFDVSRQTFRSEKYPEYKAGRSATPDEFRGQIDITKEVLGALGITVLAEPGFEADDVIATLATQAAGRGLPGAGGQRRPRFAAAGQRRRHRAVPAQGRERADPVHPGGCRREVRADPAQYPDFAALRGDPSDNLPGIPGVGEKTASKWIVEYGSLQALVDNVDTVKGKVGDALRANLSHVVLNRELTDLVKDVPLAQTPDTLRMLPWDRDQIHRLFDDLEFRVLRDRLFETLAAVEPEVEHGFDVRGGGAGARRAGGLAVRAQPRQPVRGGRGGYPSRVRRRRHGAGHRRPPTGTAATSTPRRWTPRTRRRWRPGWPIRVRPRRCTRRSSRCTTSRAAAGRWPVSPPTPRWPPTWFDPGSAASRSTTCRCATYDVNCVRKRPNSNSFRYSTTAKASTIRRCRR